MATTTPTISQGRSFATVFLIEMWERFGYYGMQALIVYYMVQRLGFPDHKANLVWSAAAALIYVSPAIGGWLGDKVLGTRRTMLTGTVVLALGYAMMAIPGEGVLFLYASLGIIVVGNGMFKSNAGNLVRKIYAGDDTKIDSAFTLYYMAVNIGSTFSMLLTPWVKNYLNRTYGHGWGWHGAFAVCTVGLLVGLANYAVMRQSLCHIGSDIDDKPVPPKTVLTVAVVAILFVLAAAFVLNNQDVARVAVYLAGLVVLGIFVHLIRHSEHSERAGLTVALILTVQTMFFFIFYQQMSTSLNLFALRNVNPSFDVFGMHLWNWAPAQFQSFNPIWIFILSPLLAYVYNARTRKGKDFSIATKFAMGFAVVAIGFFIYGSAAHFAVDNRTSSWVMVWGYGAGGLGELLVSGLGLAMISRYVPARMGGFMMGAYFVASGVSQYLGGIVANFATVGAHDVNDAAQTMIASTRLFNNLGWAGVACTVLSLAMLPTLRKLSATHHFHNKANNTPLPTIHSEQ